MDFHKNKFTRTKILQDIGKTEDNINNGISVQEMVPFFEKNKLQLRVIDQMYRCIYKYDPTVRNHNHKSMYVMVDGNHVYTLNDELSSLQQHLEEEKEAIVRASSEFKTNYKTEEVEYKMIESIEDILIIVKATPKPKKGKNVIINLIYKGNYLTELLYELINVGYRPQLGYSAGQISRLVMSFNGIQFRVKSQRLIEDSVDGEACVDDVDVFSKLEMEMSKFSKDLFSPETKSYYNQLVLQMLNEYKSKPQDGILKEANQDNVQEIDINKAYTHSFTQMNEVPVFNEFDSFVPYIDEAIQPYNLYVVKSSNMSLFCQKTYSLCYGKFLIHMIDDVEILSFIKPSFIKPVDYKKIVHNLYESTISNDSNEDKHLKKLIANVNIGILEKGTNKANKSYIFNTLEEAQQKQLKYSGTIAVVSKTKLVEILEEEMQCNPLDFGLDLDYDS